MTDDNPNSPPRSAADVLREALAAKHKAAAKGGPPGAGRESERTAAARSAAKSRPAMRK